MSDPKNMSLHGAVDLSGLLRKNARPAPSTSSPAPSSKLVQDVTEAQMGEIVALSNSVPVILEFYGQGHAPALGPLIESYQGRLVLATIDVARAAELVRGLGVSGIPTVFAILQGRPAPLFQGMPPEADVRKVLDEVLTVAAQAGVTGRVDVVAEEQQVAEEAPVPTWQSEAEAALSRNDFDAARTSYQHAVDQDPKNYEALSGLARVALLHRIHASGLDATTIRSRAADQPGDVPAQLLVADLDLAGGHLDDAFRRLLDLFAAANSDRREPIKARLIELFDAAGPSHPATLRARQALASLLY